MASKVILCGIDISNLPKYSPQDLATMLNEAQCGNERARTKFIFANIKLVLSIIHRFTNRYNNIDDLFQVGCVGLIKAMDNFDASLNLKFSTYAVPMIIGEVRRFLRDNSSVRVTRSMRDLAYRALQSRERFSHDKNYDPNIEEIALDINEPYEKVVCALDAISDAVSLYDPIYNDGGDTIEIIDQVSDSQNSAEKNTQNLIIKQALQHLPNKERSIINMRYFLGKTQIEISNEVGISQAQVSRLEKNALKMLRASI